MSNLRYFLQRTVITFFLICLVASTLFFLFRLMPGDYLSYMAGHGADPDTLENLREEWGLNEPLYVQYWTYVTSMITGDMGYSYRFRAPVIEVAGEAIINSFILAAPAITFTYILGSIIGALMGTHRGEASEKFGIVPITFIGTIPEFFTGILLLVIFAYWFNIFPTGGMMPIQFIRTSYLEMMTTTTFWLHYVLPFLTIVFKILYFPTLMMRTSMIEVQGQDFIHYNRMKGLPRVTRLKHLMKHASLPVITLYPISMGNAIGGLVIIEVVFNWPGIGWLLVESVFQRDYPTVQFVFFLIACWVIIGNYLVDLLYSVIDPRVTVEGQESD